jgi:DUF4097 and DUF4098 domain-containing protein YvlB
MNKTFPLFLAVPVVLALSAGGCVNYGRAQFERSITLTAPTIEPKPVRITTGNGSIKLAKSTTGQVEITAESALTTEARRDSFAVRAVTIDGTFVIEPVWPEGKRQGSEKCSFIVMLPEATQLELKTSNGAIELDGFAGEADLDTSNGAIRVKNHDGPLTLDTSNGAIDVKGATAKVRAETSNGRIEITFADGATGPVTAKTSNGAITLEVPAAFAGTLTMSTSNGSISAETTSGAKADLKKKSGTITFAPTGGESSLKTSNGSITFKQRSSQ